MINGYVNNTFNSQDTLISQKDQWLGFDCVVLYFIFWMKALNLLHWILLGWSLNDNIDEWNHHGDQFVNWWFLFNHESCNLIDQMVNDPKKNAIQQIMLNQMGIFLPIETSWTTQSNLVVWYV